MSGGDEADGSAGTEPRPRRILLLAIARTLLTVLGVLVLYFALPLNRGFGPKTVLGLFLGLVGVGLLVAWQVRYIVRSAHPALRAIEATALMLPLFLLLFAGTYVVLATSDAHAFSQPLTRIDTLYFVITVFTTVGFGDITPVSEVARVLTTVQMIGDLVLIGLVLRVFLAAVDRGRHPTRESERGSSGDAEP